LIDNPTGVWDPSSPLYALSETQKADIVHGWVRGYRIMFLTFTCLAVVNVFVAVFFIKRHSLDREEEAELKAEGKAWIAQRGQKNSRGQATEQPDIEKAEPPEPATVTKSEAVSSGVPPVETKRTPS